MDIVKENVYDKAGTRNIFNKYEIEIGKYIGAAGEIVKYYNNEVYISKPIPVEAGGKYYKTLWVQDYLHRMCVYTSNGTPIAASGGFANPVNYGVMTIPDNGAYVIIGGLVSELDKTQLELDTRSTYIPHTTPCDYTAREIINRLNNKTIVSLINLVSCVRALAWTTNSGKKYYESLINSLDAGYAEIKQNCLIDSSGNPVWADDNRQSTGFIEIPTTAESMELFSGSEYSEVYFNVRCYNASHNFIGSATTFSGQNVLSSEVRYFVKGTKYIRVIFALSNNSELIGNKYYNKIMNFRFYDDKYKWETIPYALVLVEDF